MAGLSPEGKRKLIDRRLAWVLSHDEWEPEGFALPPQYQPQRPRLQGNGFAERYPSESDE